MKRLLIPIAAVAMALSGAAYAQTTDPLPSWNDGPTKEAIVGFVEKVTEEGDEMMLSQMVVSSVQTVPL